MSEERKFTRTFSLLENPTSCITPPSKSPLIYSRTMSTNSGAGSSGIHGSTSSSLVFQSNFTFENLTFRFDMTWNKLLPLMTVLSLSSSNCVISIHEYLMNLWLLICLLILNCNLLHRLPIILSFNFFIFFQSYWTYKFCQCWGHAVWSFSMRGNRYHQQHCYRSIFKGMYFARKPCGIFGAKTTKINTKMKKNISW